MYRLSRFDPARLSRLASEITDYAAAIGGLPRSHEECLKKRGWLLPFLFGYDSLLWGRWDYWLDLLQKGTIAGSGPIPRIEWAELGSTGVQATKKMFERCMSHHEATIDRFADWLLWGLAGTDTAPAVSERLNEHFYREFDMFLVLDNPTDYLSQLLCDATGKGYKQGLGYFPTPFQITRMMVEMTYCDGDTERMKRQTVMDPCVGCGAMLLPASNYYLRGYGTDISSIAVKLCSIQMYFYAPWFARPGELAGFEEEETPIQIIPAAPIRGRRVTADQLAFSF